jgi:two-component system cell cycle sensor histidine kinase/response regulator CckA
VLGRDPISLLVVEEEQAAVQGVIDDMIAGAVRTRHENYWRARDGRLHRIAWSNSAIVGPAGRVKYLVGVGTDHTEHRELEERVRRHEEQLRENQSLGAIGRLATGLAHDFNNLLTTILGHSQIVMAEHANDDDLRRDMQAVLDAATLAGSLTHQLLAFGRGHRVQPRVLSLGVIVADMMVLLRRVMGNAVTLRVVEEPDVGQVLADPTQIRQTLVNLALNARDAMPQGGTFEIRLGNRAVTADSPRGVPPGDYVLLEVRDDGIGMSDEVRARAFEPFFTTKDPFGTGLGLATVQGIVKQGGGHVWVDSAPGRGTTFFVYLPRVTAPEDAAPGTGS